MMAESSTQCKYSECPHPLYQNEEWCIFHLPKLSAEDKKKLSAEEAKAYARLEYEFRLRLYALIKQVNSDIKAERCDFIGFKFVDIDLSFARLKQEIDGWQGFQKPADFSFASFQQADLIQASFQQAEFFNASFQQADFSFASFQKADFRVASFQQAILFFASFQEANFSGASFQEANFTETRFNEKTNFNDASIQKQINFEGSIENKVFEGQVSFEEVRLEPDAKVIFEKVNLSQASFLGTNLENFEFRDVDWFSKGRREKALWDEFSGEKVEDLAKLADNYHQLVLNYEKKREFDTALEFRIGEMEVIRKQKATSKNKIRHWLQLNAINFHAWYKYLSYYGTSYWRAFAALGIMLLLSAGVFMLSGFGHADQAPGNPETIIKYVISLRDPAHLGKLFKDFVTAIGFSFSILTIQRTPYYEALGPWSNFLTGLARLVFYSQAALLLLAIRRRFKQ